jgi:hypothetical protein
MGPPFNFAVPLQMPGKQYTRTKDTFHVIQNKRGRILAAGEMKDNLIGCGS